ncbi:hypothetical protein F2Q68_00017042 [Brassica cretica]|uniref:Uncharacterized protein n=2 Tax=Brassica cretica TaxID=69181 RepID=A0A3N6R2M6_BRACR|nr:hypothetical protein F2Q68_00017042 [Brassica cretica]KAF3608685.1 hypothetical protein DY000_02049586 [Brassica cretica]
MLSSIYIDSDAPFPSHSCCMSGSWCGAHYRPIACVGFSSTIGGRCSLCIVGSCSLHVAAGTAPGMGLYGASYVLLNSRMGQRSIFQQ